MQTTVGALFYANAGFSRDYRAAGCRFRYRRPESDTVRYLREHLAPNLTPAAAQVYFKEDRPASYVATRGLQFLVAEQNEELLAFVDWEGDFVNALHVRPSHAPMGLGNRLMAAAETQILHSGFATARLETDTFNTRSQAFYAARGYHEVDRYPDEEWNSGLTTILFVKLLN